MTFTKMNNTDRIRELNDEHRRRIPETKTVLTMGIDDLWKDAVYEILREIRDFRDFNEWNNPHFENDFGAFDYKGKKIYFKIDYFDKEYRYGSEDPSDPDKTWRILTAMLADEY